MISNKNPSKYSKPFFYSKETINQLSKNHKSVWTQYIHRKGNQLMLNYFQKTNSLNRRTKKPPYRTIICIYHLSHFPFQRKERNTFLGLLLLLLVDGALPFIPWCCAAAPYFIYFMIYTCYLDTSTSNIDPLRPRSLFIKIYCGCSTTKPNKKSYYIFLLLVLMGSTNI